MHTEAFFLFFFLRQEKHSPFEHHSDCGDSKVTAQINPYGIFFEFGLKITGPFKTKKLSVFIFKKGHKVQPASMEASPILINEYSLKKDLPTLPFARYQGRSLRY